MAKEPQKDKPAPKGDTPFRRFERLARNVVAVPKNEIEKRESEWRKQREKKKQS